MLAQRRPSDRRTIHALAQGWPAIIGLASVTELPLNTGQEAERLYRYVSEEFFDSAKNAHRTSLLVIGLLPHSTRVLLRDILPECYPTSIDHLAAADLIQLEAEGVISIHPLLQIASRKWMSLTDDPYDHDLLRKSILALLNRGMWSSAFSLIKEFDERDLFQRLLVSGLSLDSARRARCGWVWLLWRSLLSARGVFGAAGRPLLVCGGARRRSAWWARAGGSRRGCRVVVCRAGLGDSAGCCGRAQTREGRE